MTETPTTTQAVLEDLLCFAVRESGADPAPYLARFRKAVAGQMNHAPDPLFLAEVTEAKRKIMESCAHLKRNAVNGMVPAPVVITEIEKAALWATRFDNAEAN